MVPAWRYDHEGVTWSQNTSPRRWGRLRIASASEGVFLSRSLFDRSPCHAKLPQTGSTFMHISTIAVALAGLIALAGCVSETSTFHSPDGRYTVACSGAGFGIVRGTMAMNEYRNCREVYLKAGYIDGPAPAGAQPALPIPPVAAYPSSAPSAPSMAYPSSAPVAPTERWPTYYYPGNPAYPGAPRQPGI
jgi:hypothetical protein